MFFMSLGWICPRDSYIPILYMEIKKITAFALFIVLFSLYFGVLTSCDLNPQYKQIGDTNFYLLPDWQGHGSYLHHSGGLKNGFYNITHDGVVSDVYWNAQFLIIKCSPSENDTIKDWYIMKNIKEYSWKKFDIMQLLNVKDYETALDSMGLSEKQMEHTDGTIPWRIHL